MTPPSVPVQLIILVQLRLLAVRFTNVSTSCVQHKCATKLPVPCNKPRSFEQTAPERGERIDRFDHDRWALACFSPVKSHDYPVTPSTKKTLQQFTAL
jgi:hypothetical protein